MHIFRNPVTYVHDNRNAEVPTSSSQDCSVAAKQQKLIEMFQNCTSLKGLEVGSLITRYLHNNLSDHHLSLVSYFPSITSYRLCELYCCHTLKQIFSSKYLRCLYLSSYDEILPSLEDYCSSLRQLCIHARDASPTETFIDALCGHGGLEHVILSVETLTAKSISSIIEKSPNLMTFHVILHTEVLKGELIPLLATIKTKFSKRKLFNGGNFDLRQDICVNDYSFLNDTDLLSIWDGNN